MLLLYLIHLLPADQRFANLHSTMLLLYRISPLAHSILTSIFTFHYASTLSRIAEVVQTSGSNLHSTMLLLYLVNAIEKGWLFNIYIPLCFYFIGNPRQLISISALFTFHYASTLSNSEYDIPHRIAKFTFHYASTLSRHIISSFDEILHLHSTMLLLYQRLGRVDCNLLLFTFHYASTLSKYRDDKTVLQFIIYIPLCFYFIPRPEAGSFLFYWFTFHYASTLSIRKHMNDGWIPDLHSTMLLLYVYERGQIPIIGVASP